MAKKAYVYDGSAWQDLSSSISDLSQYANLNTYQPTFRNAIINGSMQIWQRGTSFTASTNTANFTADRWQNQRSGAAAGFTTSRVASGLTGFQYAMRVARDSGQTTTATYYQQYSAETADSIKLAGKNVVLSFYARAGANYSATSSLLNIKIYSGTGTDQSVSTGLTGSTTINATNSVTLSTNWQRFSITGTMPSNSTQFGLEFSRTSVGTAGAADYYEITGVQLEQGSVATPFEQRPVGTELALCQRYYQILKSGAYNSPALHRLRSDQNSYDVALQYLVKPRISSGFGYTINSPTGVIHKPAVRWDTISSIGFTDMGTYVNINCVPSADDGSAQYGLYLYGIDIYCNAEL